MATKSKAKPKSEWLAVKGYRGIMRSNKTGKYRARITVNVNGKRQQITRQADTRQDALKLYFKLVETNKKGGKARIDSERVIDRMTFGQLADEYVTDHIIEPVYDDEHSDDRNKQAGVVGVEDGKRAMELFKAAFGEKRLTDITSQDIKKWKIARLKTPKARGGGKRSLASVHRELAFLRGAFSYAIPKYLKHNPFTGAKLILQKQEKERDRVLTFEEEKLLLGGAASKPLASLLIFMLDSAARVGESLQVERRDVELDKGLRGLITLRARITKGKVKREVPVLTSRLRQVIEERLAAIPSDPNARLFDRSYYSYENAFQTAVKQAGLTDIRLHDCRHTAITRAVPSGIPLPEAMKMTGHKKVETFLRYVNPTAESHRVNAERFEAYLLQGQAAANNQPTATELIQ